MPLIWCSISAHGYGHAAQVVPVLNELGARVPNLKVILRTEVPPTFFKDTLKIPWMLSRACQDVGCVQQGPLHIDVASTWNQLKEYHDTWDVRLQEEIRLMREATPRVVLSDISYLAIEAGHRAGIPTVGLCNLSWDAVLEALLPMSRDANRALLDRIRRSYGFAHLMIRLEPGISMPFFAQLKDVGPVVLPYPEGAADLRREMGASPSDAVVLVSMGGVRMDEFPYPALEDMSGYRFIVVGTVPDGYRHIREVRSLRCSYHAIFMAADIVVSKPGYNTVVEAVSRSKPFAYVRRRTFVDEQTLVQYLHKYGRGIEFSPKDFVEGRWREALDALRRLPVPPEQPPAPTGAQEAADLLEAYLR